MKVELPEMARAVEVRRIDDRAAVIADSGIVEIVAFEVELAHICTVRVSKKKVPASRVESCVNDLSTRSPSDSPETVLPSR